VPGLYGTLTRLELDVACVPRVEQFQGLVASPDGSFAPDRPSDMKTVAYFMAEEQTGGVGVAAGQRHGLVRRELDRAWACYAAEQGQLEQIDLNLEPIAPEVAGVEFRYFDGQQWLEAWDSQAQGCLPTAVEITLIVARTQPGPGFPDSSLVQPSLLQSDSSQQITYRLVVHLPAAAPSSTNALNSSGESSAESGQSSTEAAGTNQGGSAK